MKRFKQLAATILTTLSVCLLSTSALAQNNDDRPIGNFAMGISKNLGAKCAYIIDHFPANQGQTYSGKKSQIDPNYTTTGWTMMALCEGVFSKGYRALRYGYVTIDSISRGATTTETRDNTYRTIEKALSNAPDYLDGLAYISRRKDISRVGAKELVLGINRWVIQAYAAEFYGIKPPTNRN